MRKYLINNKVVSKTVWSEAFQSNPEATVILRLETIPKVYEPNIGEQSISPEKAKAIREQYKSRE